MLKDDDQEAARRRFWRTAPSFDPVSVDQQALVLDHLRRRAEGQLEAEALAQTLPRGREGRKDPEALAHYLALVRSLREAGKMNRAQYLFHIASRFEGLHDERMFQGGYDDALKSVREAMDAIEAREGLGPDEYWLKGDEPEGYAELGEEYNAILDRHLCRASAPS